MNEQDIAQENYELAFESFAAQVGLPFSLFNIDFTNGADHTWRKMMWANLGDRQPRLRKLCEELAALDEARRR